MYELLAIMPIAILLVVSLIKGVKSGIYLSLVVTCILFFVWDSTVETFAASLIAAFVDTVSILMIVFGAIFLYHTMDQKGYIADIRSSLGSIHTDRTFRFYFLAIFLTAFFESVAGFGTPGAIVPLLLISMGYSAVTSISAVLLIDGLFAISGAVGTPVSIGFLSALDLGLAEVKSIYFLASLAIALSAVIVFGFVWYFVKKESYSNENYLIRLYGSIMIPFVGLSYLLQELTGLVASAVMALIAYLFFFKGKKIKLTPWLPYGLLVIILLLPKLSPSLRAFLSLELSFDEILQTKVSASLKPLRSPFLPFLIVSFFASILVRDLSFSVRPVLTKVLSVFLVLFPSLAITRLMLSSGGEIPSMVEIIATLFVQAGNIYPLLSPFIGALGTFLTGSTTVSNVIFGPVQYSSAIQLEIAPAYILALQLAGASLGNAICLFNIIAAAAVAGVDNYASILKKNLLPVILASLLAGILGYGIIYFHI